MISLIFRDLRVSVSTHIFFHQHNLYEHATFIAFSGAQSAKNVLQDFEKMLPYVTPISLGAYHM